MRFVIALLVFGCSKDASLPSSPLVGKSRALATKLCACKTRSCAEAIDAEWNAVAKDQTTQQLTAEDIEALATETQRYTQCLAALTR